MGADVASKNIACGSPELLQKIKRWHDWNI